MRIISGKWRGHKLVPFKSKTIRPTTDFIKESIFNSIGGDIVDSLVLDLFCGTGNLGFEALSRGAEKVIAVDMGKDSKKIVKLNYDKLKVSEGYKFLSQDVFNFLKKDRATYDFIFVDPPFTQKLAQKCIEVLTESKVLKDETLIFIECVKGEQILEETEKLILFKKKNYGDKLLCVYTVKGKKIEEESE